MIVDLHGLLPSLRRELRRGARFSLIVGMVAVAAAVLAARLQGGVALVPGGVALLAAVLVWFGPLAHLGSDRLHGYLEFDRTLPIALRVMAAGRLLGAAVRVLPLLPATVALLIGFRQLLGPAEMGDTVALMVIPLVVQVAATVFLWLLLALNARWSFRRLWWLPTTIGFLPQLALMLLPRSAQQLVAQWAATGVEALSSAASKPLGAVLMALIAGMLILVVFSGAAILFASGLLRYRFDPTAIGAVMGRASRIELRAIGRGPLLAVARLRLRLATEQFRRELAALVVLFLVAVFGPQGARDFARSYIPVLAALLPAGIALQLFTGRATGELEGMQQLPLPATTVGLGHLLAIATMAMPGAVALQLLRAMSGTVPTVLSVTGSWAWFVAIAWGGAAVGLWFQPRYLLLLLAAVAAVPLIAMGVGVEAGLFDTLVRLHNGFRALRASAGPALPFGVALLSVLLGVPLFAHGLTRYPARRG